MFVTVLTIRRGRNNYADRHQSVFELLINISIISLCLQRTVQQSQRSMLMP